MKYLQVLPRLINWEKYKRCQVLTEDGIRCPYSAVAEVVSHFTSDIYEAREWGVIYACKKHLEIGEKQKLEIEL